MIKIGLGSRLMVGVLLGVSVGSFPLFALDLLGAGATFPYPYYAKLADAYYKKTGVKINYQSIGSGGGIQQLKNKTVDFGASDAYLSDQELREMPAKVLHIPTCLGAVSVAFNLPGINALNFSESLLAEIFLGKVKFWDDAKIAKLNPGVKLPHLAISTVHRSDGSGTTSIFTGFLTKSDPEWKSKVGSGKSVNWPTGLGSKGNAGVAGMIKQLPGSVGYVEHLYAKQNRMSVGAIRNGSGKFVLPSLSAITQAAQSAVLPADTRLSLVDVTIKNGYPISGFTWILVYQNAAHMSFEKSKALVSFLNWVLKDGQAFASELDYAPLNLDSVNKARAVLRTVKGS